MPAFFNAVWNSIIEYETPRLVKIHNRKVGLVRRLIQMGIILYVAIYALWLQKGYQEFGRVESSVTTKIKGITKSELDPDSKYDPEIYTRVWDVADYVVPPAENSAFFVATNVIITPNQTRGTCPEDNFDVKGVTCQPDLSLCSSANTLYHFYAGKKRRRRKRQADNDNNEDEAEETKTSSSAPTTAFQVPFTPTTPSPAPISSSSSVPSAIPNNLSVVASDSEDDDDDDELESASGSDNVTVSRCVALPGHCPKGAIKFKAHGPLTGNCVPSDRPKATPDIWACEVESWCPIEIDTLPLGKKRALMAKAADYTVFIKNSIAFPYFGRQYVRNNLISNNGRPCIFKLAEPDPGCQIFRLGDMVKMAGGNFSKMAIKGGVVSLSIAWHCNLDYDFMKYCLPQYNFRILDDFGWNFRHAKYHEENRRTLYKMYGIKFLITIEGRGGKFNLKNTILNIGSGLALLGVTTVVCDFLLMYIKEKSMIKQKKYDYVDVKVTQAQLAPEAAPATASAAPATKTRTNTNGSCGGKAKGEALSARELQELNHPVNSMVRDLSTQPMLPRDTSSYSSFAMIDDDDESSVRGGGGGSVRGHQLDEGYNGNPAVTTDGESIELCAKNSRIV